MQIDYIKILCKEDVHICSINFAKQMEWNLPMENNWLIENIWKMTVFQGPWSLRWCTLGTISQGGWKAFGGSMEWRSCIRGFGRQSRKYGYWCRASRRRHPGERTTGDKQDKLARSIFGYATKYGVFDKEGGNLEGPTLSNCKSTAWV